VKVSQDKVIKKLQSLDSSIEVLGHSRLVGNFIRVKATPEAIAKIKLDANVKSVVADTSIKSVKDTKNNAAINVAKRDSAPQSEITPPMLSDDVTAGEGVKVAIIGSGVDYTHKSLGGTGTLDDYMAALENGANEFEGFPTDVVVEGFDFSSDAGWGLDPNPIDQAMEYTHWDESWSYDNGHGTRMASTVRNLAPGVTLAAYKTSNVSANSYSGEPQASVESGDKFVMALERAIDPNQDGSFDDRADIIIVDAIGGNAFYVADDSSISGAQVDLLAIEMASGAGSLVVVNAGEGAVWYDNKFNMTFRGAAPSALTVSALTSDADGNMKVRADSPHGPVRGSDHYSKPDLVSYAENVNVATVGTGEDSHTYTRNLNAAARIAAAAAIVKSKRPELSMQQVKAVLMNTANSNVMDYDGKEADLTLVGSGVEHMAAALTTPIVVSEHITNQPNMSFGFVEMSGKQSFTKQLQVKNTSEAAVTYDLAHNMMAKDSNDALTWNYPTSVTVAAGKTLLVDVTLNVDFGKVANWPINTASEMTADNWAKIELNGRLTLSADEKPDVNVGWMVKPRSATEITRHFDTYTEVYGHEWVDAYREFGSGLSQNFTNNSAQEKTFAVYPVMLKGKIEDGKEKSAGHMIEAVGGGVFDAPSCSSGKKLSLAVRYHAPSDAGIANHFDKGGAAQMWFNTYDEQVVIDYGWDKSLDSDPANAWLDEASQVPMSGFIEVDENGEPHAWFIDMNKTYDWSNPRGRYTKSSLPAKINAHGQNVVAEYCMEDLYHGEFDSLEKFDQNTGWVFATDRDAKNDLGEAMAVFNPFEYGSVFVEEYFDEWSQTLYVYETKQGTKAAFTQAELAEGEVETFSEQVTLAPGESAKLMAARGCDAFFGIGGGAPCNNQGLMLMSLDDNWGMWTPTGVGEYSFIPSVKENQTFNVAEGVETGSVVGTVALDHQGFFANADFEDDYNPIKVILAGGVTDDAFALDSTGVITVNNAAALDYESGITEYAFEAYTREGNTHTGLAKVTINLTDVNDVAPVFSDTVADITIDQSGSIDINVAQLVSDVEGDVITYTATGLPEGVSIDSVSGVISGTASVAGSYTVEVTADDSMNQTTTSFMIAVNAPIVVEEPKSKSSSGSFGAMLFSILGLGGLLRRRSIKK